jgi:Dyp-type peroxidase family
VFGVGALSWCGAIAGWAAPLTIGAFVVVGARHRRSYDAWRDTMTELGDGLDAVATAFVVVNVVVAGLLGVLAWSVQHTLHSLLITIPVIVAAVGSFVFALTACEKRCRYPRCEGEAPRLLHRLHLLAAGVVVADIVAVPIFTWFALRHRGDDFTVFRVEGLVLASVAAVLAAVMLQQAKVKKRADDAEQATTAMPGLFERLVWVAGYGWVVALAYTLVRPGWTSALVLVAWLALALWYVLRPDWRDPSPQFSIADCQPGMLTPFARSTYGLLLVGTFDNPEKFREELADALTSKLIKGSTDEATRGLTIAFTAKGLRALGVQYRWNAPFVEDAFGKGMLARAESLGDTGLNAPEHWDDGWRQPERLHVAFWMQGGITEEAKEAVAAAANADVKAAAYTEAGEAAETELTRLDDLVTRNFRSVKERLRVPTNRLGPTSREHFGFVDGLSQPWVDGIEESRQGGGGGKLGVRSGSKAVALGEFVVGQVDETGDIFPVPDPHDVFLGGTFLVVRKLQQDVAGFRSYAGADDAANTLAQRLIGRTRDGVVLEDPSLKDLNDFTYGDDPEGTHCPLGAHIRRSNPRDALGFRSTLSVRRRIIRRGMPYGRRWREPPDQTDRGLLFLACNVRIAEQFEFIQKQWLNDGSPFGLGNVPDPASGLWPPGSQRPLVVTGRPPEVRADLRSFVTTKGGEYFFVPSVRGLRALADLSQRDIEPVEQVGAASGDRRVTVAPS